MEKQGAGGAKTHLTKDELLEKLRRREKHLDLPGGLGSICIQGLSVDDFSAVRSMGEEETESADLFKRVCLLGIVDPELSADDLEALGKSDLGAVTAIANEIMQLSGMMDSGDAADFTEDTQKEKESSSTA